MREFNQDIFKYLNPKENDKFSSYSKDGIQDLLNYIDKFFLEYRSSLNISSDILFGLEIEASSLSPLSFIDDIIFKLNINDWSVEQEKSITDGFEVISPVLNNNIGCWNDLKKLCLAINPYASINNECGGHVHVGAHVLGEKKESWLNFIKLWAVYEHIIFRFCYGEYLTNRSKILGFAQPCSSIFMRDYAKFIYNNSISLDKVIHGISHNEKGLAVNLMNVVNPSSVIKKNTIEFRCPNGTLNPIIWQNNVNLFAHILMYAKSENYDDDIVSKRCYKISDSSLKLKIYNKIYLKGALELADLIFDNNLDKLYFLRQYLKSYEVGTECLQKTKPFTLCMKK